MKLAITCCILAVLVSVGCRKKTTPTDSNTPTTSSDAPAAPKGEFTPAPAVPADSPAAKAHSEMDQKLASGNPQLQLQVLNELFQAWFMSKNSAPKDLNEFVTSGMLKKLPVPQAGKKFAINQQGTAVVLINQ